MMTSQLIRAAKHSARREALQNYIIAACCGIIIGAMLALAI